MAGGSSSARRNHVVARHGAERVRLPIVGNIAPRDGWLPIVGSLQPPDGWEPILGPPPGGREHCRDGPRPCRYVQCEYHLWYVAPEDRAGGDHISSKWKANHDEGNGPAIRATPVSCELDVTERKPDAAVMTMTVAGQRITLELVRSPRTIGKALALTRQRVGQIVREALAKLARAAREDPEVRERLIALLRR